jgi:hypothetical protein
MCAPCVAVRQAEAARQESTYAPENYFQSGLARTELLNSGVQPIKIYLIGKK